MTNFMLYLVDLRGTKGTHEIEEIFFMFFFGILSELNFQLFSDGARRKEGKNQRHDIRTKKRVQKKSI
jgi:hypothetical protein